jgi:hypothetical protein
VASNLEDSANDSATEASDDKSDHDTSRTESASEDGGLTGDPASVKRQLQAEVRVVYEASCVAHVDGVSYTADCMVSSQGRGGTYHSQYY